MDESVLPLGLTRDALAAAAAQPEPDSLAAGTRLRTQFGPDVAAAALTQVSLRRRARVKFGPDADDLFFTRDGLEQATRPEVADLHAARFVAAGVDRVVDLGCGIGADAAAFLRAGLDVLAVDVDATTAAVARANLSQVSARRAGTVEVRCQAAADAVTGLRPTDGVFADPARRGNGGRIWRVADFSPTLSSVLDLAGPDRAVGIKLGPALPHRFVPSGWEAEWVSHRGDVVEVGLWSGPAASAGRWNALVWPDQRLITEPGDRAAELRTAQPADLAPGTYLYEPDGAVIRAGGVQTLGRRLDASLLDPQIAYLIAPSLHPSPFATAFEVLQVLPYEEKRLRRWVSENDVGNVEIKRRGVEVDPAVLRRRLRPGGRAAATLLLSRTPAGAVAFVVRRLAAG